MTARLVIIVMLLVAVVTDAKGQQQQDFASRFMALHPKEAALECTTVSPVMMERMLQLPNVEDDASLRQVLAQLKSIRMVTCNEAAHAEKLFDDALKLARKNPKRYKLHAEEEHKKLYVRRRGKLIVEMVLFMVAESHFSLINLTGNMNEKFLEQLMQL